MSSRKHEINTIIGQLQNTDGIYAFIEGMDIPKTTNSNGIFVNLSVLGDDDIDLIYDFISNIKVEDEVSIDISDEPLPLEINATKYTDDPPEGHSYFPVKKTTTPYPKVKLTALQRTILSVP